ncbi:MAG: ABC transporter permease [Bacteroidales bacterium]|nr:ABC transporter permease [Bacteroidales bacterium]
MKSLVSTFRYLKRDRAFSWINLAGLAIGLTAVLYITVYLWQESHYDDFHVNGDKLYQVSIELKQGGKLMGEQAQFVAALAPAIRAELPEAEAVSCFSSPRTVMASYEEQLLKMNRVYFADSSFLKLFTFPLVEGDINTALSAPYTVVLTEKAAKNLFGRENPVGKSIMVNGDMPFSVTGVLADLPANSQFNFEALASFPTFERMMPAHFFGWRGGNQFATFVQVSHPSQLADVEDKINRLIWTHIGEEYSKVSVELKGSLQAVRDVHLHHSSESKSLRMNLWIFSIVALLILVVAGINFVNLTAARSLRRIREAGVRKLIGARKTDLVKLFLGESLLVSLTAFVWSLLLFWLLNPFYVQLSGTPVTDFVFPNLQIVGGVFLLTVLIGVLAGSYPALRLSALPLGDAAKGGGVQKMNRHRVQNALIVAQFAISTGLIVSTLVISGQLSFINRKDTGMNRDGILILPLENDVIARREPLLKHRLENLPGVSAVSASSDVPAGWITSNGYFPEGMTDVMVIKVLDADENFLEVYGITLKSGRFFNGGDADKTCYVINEALAKLLDWNDGAVGKHINRNGNYEVIGVVRDFHYESLYSEIQPLIITCQPEGAGLFSDVSVKFGSTGVTSLIGHVKEVWKEVNPDVPFEYRFFDDVYDSQYKAEQQFRMLFFSFSFIAIVLATLGMLSLMAYTIEQRKKEISIRKVLGASISDVLQLLLRRTAVQILVANVIAWPVAWWLIRKWLENFAYRIQIGWAVFALALFISAFIALIAVVCQAIKAATANPVKSLKTE